MPKVERPYVPVSWGMGKENVAYPYDGRSFSHKKEGSTESPTTWGEPQNHRAERKPGSQAT